MKSILSHSRPLAVLAVALAVSGCSNLRVPFLEEKQDSPEYKRSRGAISQRSLEVPPDLTAPESSAAYDIPGLNKATLSPEGRKALESGAVLPRFDKVRLESAGGQRWLVVNAPAEKVWPQARDFWLDQGFKLTTDSPAAGLLETDWLEQRPDVPNGTLRSAISRALGTLYSTGLIDQYRMRLERNADGSTEIYISHRGMEEVFTEKDKSDTRWTVRKPEPEREAEMLKKLLVKLGVTADAAAQAVAEAKPQHPAAALAPTAPGSERARLSNQEGRSVLQLSEGFDRAWRRVGLALERNGYNVYDRDRSLGLYYIRPGVVQAKKDDSGFLSKLAFWKKEDTKSDASNSAPEYLVVVSGKGNETTVRFAAKDGSALAESSSNTMLDALLTELR
ncbi:outer membrane protein assembly factor BamC [Chitinimonas lacunae]|uniref:Outer membrane protein assembly factor BamC n=1 Tax=Chitinimonas lacunae TaxID=1963018 RepID=A0ABV8MWU1_9NEIS